MERKPEGDVKASHRIPLHLAHATARPHTLASTERRIQPRTFGSAWRTRPTQSEATRLGAVASAVGITPSASPNRATFHCENMGFPLPTASHPRGVPTDTFAIA